MCVALSLIHVERDVQSRPAVHMHHVMIIFALQRQLVNHSRKVALSIVKCSSDSWLLFAQSGKL